jgi:antitoxin (DNA-binding transcriptional repressor) of toxin-antitoxin stability system
LVDAAARGEPFIIAKAGKPLVKVIPLDAPEHSTANRLGFMAGQISVLTTSTQWVVTSSKGYSATGLREAAAPVRQL